MATDKFKPREISAPIGQRAEGPGGAVLRVAADNLSSFARVAGDLADRAAAKEGALAGAEAGLNPDFRPERKNTIRGEAFDAAALRSHGTMLDGAIREDLAKAYDADGHDPIAWAARKDEIYKARIDNLPAELKPELAAGFQRQAFAYDRDVERRVKATQLSEDAAAAQAELSARRTDFERMAYSLGLDEAADVTLSAESEDILTRLAAYGPKEAFSFGGKDFAADDTRAGLLSVEALGKQAEDLADVAGFARVKGSFDRTKGVNGKAEFLKSFRDDWKAGAGVTKTMSLAQAEKLEGWMEAEIRAGLADQRAAATALRAEVADIRSSLSDYRSFAANALTPPPGVIEGLMARAIATGDAGIINDTRGLAGLVELGKNAVKAPPMAVSQAIAQRRDFAAKNGATPQLAGEIELLEKVQDGMNTALARDPMTFAARAGVIPLLPLDLQADPDTGQVRVTPQSLAARREAANTVTATYGSPFLPFTEEESALAGALEKQGGDNLLAMSKNIVMAFGAQAPQALAQLSDKAPMTAYLGALLANGSSMSTAQDATRGVQLMAEAKGVNDGLSKAIPTNDYQPATAGSIARQLLETPLQDNPQLRGSIERTADAIYVGRKGLNATFDAPAYRRALQEAAGATIVNGVQYGGFSTSGLLAPNWMRAGSVETALTKLQAADFSAAGGGSLPVDMTGRELTLQEIRRARPVNVDVGVFELRVIEDGEEVPLADKWGHAYQLDMERLRYLNFSEWKDFVK